MLDTYSKILVMFSGGKDSLACLLHLLDLGVPKGSIELWHHDVDGQEGSSLMDWPCTRSYCLAIGRALGIRVYFSWKVQGFEGEMLRQGQRTQPTRFETPLGLAQVGGTSGKVSTRLKFPQVSADLKVRWCSAYLKIDVAAAAIRNQDRFNFSRTLVITGERAEESKSRSKYKEFEPHRADNREGKKMRHVDHWRPVHKWAEAQIWEIIEKHRINPHPAYKLGWGRVSCAACIFGNPNQWASLQAVNAQQFETIAAYEERFKTTIKQGVTVKDLAAKGTPYNSITPSLILEALDKGWSEQVILENWQMPAGAFGESDGPL